MCELFDKKDVKSWTTCSEVRVSEEGYFGFNLKDLEYRIKNENPKKMSGINEISAHTFKAEGAWYPFFLPLDRVKKQDSKYRPLKTFDELFDFLMPDSDEDDTDRKAELLLGKVYQLRHKSTGNVSYRSFYSINLSENGILINGLDLEYIFEIFEIKKDGKWVPFGIKD
jgi:hypothetical protein